MEVHRQLGIGFRESVYKDALEIEFLQSSIPFKKEAPFRIEYKGHLLRRQFYADFVVYGCIILEIKSATCIVESFIAQTLNYLKTSGLQLGIIVNFGERSLTYKRVLL